MTFQLGDAASLPVGDSTGETGSGPARVEREIVAAALAVATAESFWELPIVGRFLLPDRQSPPAPAA